jgi:DNA-binding response OmpR family regulator
MKSEARVLVVDSNVESGEHLARLIRQRGYDVRTAFDGDEALTAVESFRPECVLVDLAMPDGVKLARALRERGPNIVLIAVSAQVDLSIDHWLRKPVDLESLDTIFPDTSGK